MMVEINIAAEHAKNTKAKQIRKSRTFAELMEYSPLEAARYAVSCNIKTEICGVPVEEYIKRAEEAKEKGEPVNLEISEEENGDKVEIEEEIIAEEDDEEVIITKDDLKELLKANEIKFHHASGEKKLLELAKEHDLL